MTYVIIHGRGLQGLGATTDPKAAFRAQIDLGRAALRELSAKALIVRRSTDVQLVGMGEAAGKFADTTGPRLLDEALANGDAAKVARVQGSTGNLIRAVSPEVMPAVISRFLTMVLIGPAGAIVPASTVAAAKGVGIDAGNAAIDAGKDAARTAAQGVVNAGAAVARAGVDAAVNEPLGAAAVVGGVALFAFLYFKVLR